jgi:hypothetical protein
MVHSKARFAGNGWVPLSRAATRLWGICGAPFGRGAERPSALLHWLDAASSQGLFNAVEIRKLADHTIVVEKTRFDMNFLADSAVKS